MASQRLIVVVLVCVLALSAGLVCDALTPPAGPLDPVGTKAPSRLAFDDELDTTASTMPGGGPAPRGVVNVAPKGGNITTGTTPYDVKCPSGSYMGAITIITSLLNTTLMDNKTSEVVQVPLIAGLILSCCNNEYPITSSTNPLVTSTPTSRQASLTSGWLDMNSNGYTGIILNAGVYLDGLRLITADGDVLPDPKKSGFDIPQAPYYGGPGGVVMPVMCPTCHVISGLYGVATANNVITVGLRCIKKPSEPESDPL